MRTIDTVLFDLDDTLHEDAVAYKRAARQVADDVAAERGIDAQALLDAYIAHASAFWTALSQEHVIKPILAARIQLWYESLERVGIVDADLAQRCTHAYTNYRASVLELSPGAEALLVELRVRGCKLGIVTNGFAETHHVKIDALGLRPLCDAFFLADEMGLVKPDPRVFAHACAVLGSEPERTAMVGDRHDRDVVGAHALGLFTVWLDVRGRPLPPDAVRPDATITRIDQVLEVLPLGQGPASGVPKRVS